MKYYRLNLRKRQDLDFCFITHPPDSILLLSSYINSGEKSAPEYPENVVAKINPERGGRVLSDFIANKNLLAIVSEDAKTIIESICGNTSEYLPLRIENARGRI